jgi:hypothetical protein
MESSLSPEVINQLLINKLGEAGGKEKIAASENDIIRDRLREDSFIDKLIPQKPVQRQDLQVSLEGHDSLIKVEWLEPNSKATAMSFRGDPRENQYVRGSRFGIGFYKIKSARYEKEETELMTYPYSILDYIKQNVPKDMATIRDRQWTLHLEQAVQRLQVDSNGGATQHEAADEVANDVNSSGVTKGVNARSAASTDSYISLPLDPDDITNLCKMPVHSQGQEGGLRIDTILLTDYDFEDVMSWTVEVTGDKVQSEIIVSGWKYTTFKGRKYVRTIKTNILREGNIYGLSESQFVGKNYILNAPKFYIDKVGDMITFFAWCVVGGAIGNIAGVRKLELYPGSVVPTQLSNNTGVAADGSLYTSRLPKAEDDLFGVNNKVDAGGTYPQVVQY